MWLSGGTLTGGRDSFSRTKGQLKRTKTRTDSATASDEAVLHMKDVSCSYGLELVKSVQWLLSVHAG